MIEVFPLHEDCIRSIALDPSTQHMGVSILDINLKKPSKFKLIYANTIHGEKLCHLAGTNFNDEGKVQSRIHGVAKGYGHLLRVYNPTVAICEDNFLGASPDTFKRLVEAVTLVRLETQLYGNGLYMSSVKPNVAKEIVGANFKGTKKEDVQRGLLKYTRLDFNGFDVSKFDEHTTDSIAINLYLAELITRDRGVLLDA